MTLLYLAPTPLVITDGRASFTAPEKPPCLKCDGRGKVSDWMTDAPMDCPTCHGSGIAPVGTVIYYGHKAGTCPCAQQGLHYEQTGPDLDGSPLECQLCDGFGDWPAAITHRGVLDEWVQPPSGNFTIAIVYLSDVVEIGPITEWPEPCPDCADWGCSNPHARSHLQDGSRRVVASVADLPLGWSPTPKGLNDE
jgi:hypothetical protein